MTIRAIGKRVSALEGSSAAGREMWVWQEPEETAEEALARAFGDGPRPDAVTMVRWASNEDEAAADPSRHETP